MRTINNKNRGDRFAHHSMYEKTPRHSKVSDDGFNGLKQRTAIFLACTLVSLQEKEMC